MLPGAKVTVPRLGVEANAETPIYVTLAGISMLVRAVIVNAPPPIDVTLVGIVMLVMPVLRNALAPIV